MGKELALTRTQQHRNWYLEALLGSKLMPVMILLHVVLHLIIQDGVGEVMAMGK
jgi:hypothetical protein